MTAQLANRRRVPNRIARLLAASALSSLLALPALAQQATTTDQGSTVLEAITLKVLKLWATLGGEAEADTGTTVLTEGQINARTGDGGDANAVLRNLPNVQYQNEYSTDAGATDQTVIDTRPREVSISGARVYENNFILNGIEINNITGSMERYGDEDLTDGHPNADRIYGLHSQTVFVPVDFLSDATVIDSNASAKYGNFQGGVVSYTLSDANKERWKTTFRTDFSTSDWAEMNLQTEDGLNPNDVEQPSFLKRRNSVSVSGPVTDWLSILGQYSRESASTSKDKQYQYGDDRAGEDSTKDFYRLQGVADTDLGDFTLEGIYSHYSQEWESNAYRNHLMDNQNDGWTTKLQNDYSFSDFSLGGIALSNVKLQSRLSYDGSNTINDANGNVSRVYTQTETLSKAVVWTSAELSSWCRTDPTKTSSTLCYDGAWGDKEQGEKTFSWSEELTGDIGLGSFLLGADYSHTDASRSRPEDFTYYTAGTTVWDRRAAGITAFTCNTTEACSAEQYANIKTIWSAYDLDAQVQEFNAYGELDQTWQWLNVRAGLRLSVDDYQENLNLAPRVVATITPWEEFSVSAGYNRYYNATSLAYAIRDQQPRGQSYRRSDAAGVVGNIWTKNAATGNYKNSASGLDTPYNDEFSAAIKGTEGLFDGQWRVRFLDRRARDQFASSDLGSNVYELTNDGTGAYQSVTAEYSKDLPLPDLVAMTSLSFNTSLTWSRQEVSNDSYYEDDALEERIWYNDQSYSIGGFGVITGNMDIPLRLQAGLSSSWLDDTLQVDVSANYNFAFDGVVDTGTTKTYNGVLHQIWEDHRFSPTLTVDLALSYALKKTETSDLTLNFRANNLFNETGNVTASHENPWLIGRTIWAGVSGSF